jgi:hypothetical protein
MFSNDGSMCNFINMQFAVLIYFQSAVFTFTFFFSNLESILNLLFNNNSKLVVCGDINVGTLTDNKK